MMVFLASIYDVPELNIGFHFYLRSDEDDPERTPLHAGDKGMNSLSPSRKTGRFFKKKKKKNK